MEMEKIIRLEDPYTKVKITITMPFPVVPEAVTPEYQRRKERQMLNTAHCMIFDLYSQIMLPDMANRDFTDIYYRHRDAVKADRTAPKNFKE